MDGKGPRINNQMIEGLWRSLKYECVCLHAFERGSEAKAGIWKMADLLQHRASVLNPWYLAPR